MIEHSAGYSLGITADERKKIAENQPTVTAWFDVENHNHIQSQSLGYAGTVNMVSLPGEYYLSPNFNRRYALIHGHDGEMFLRGNLCLHRQAPLLTDEHGILSAHPKHGRMTSCPIHRWTYDETGNLFAIPKGFDGCARGSLRRELVENWRGHLFADEYVNGKLDSFGMSNVFKPELFHMNRFSEVVHVRHYDTPYNPLIFELNYLDVYHVGSFHDKTFAEVADCSTLEWEFGERYSVQVVEGVRKDSIPIRYETGWARLAAKMHDHLPEIAEHPFAIWAHIYPGHMMELYFGHLLAISYLVPISPTECDNVVEYYISKEAYEKLGDGLSDEFIATYRTSADEDDNICKQLQDGWKILERNGESRMFGSFHNPQEDGIVHYLKWLKSIKFNFDV